MKAANRLPIRSFPAALPQSQSFGLAEAGEAAADIDYKIPTPANPQTHHYEN